MHYRLHPVDNFFVLCNLFQVVLLASFELLYFKRVLSDLVVEWFDWDCGFGGGLLDVDEVALILLVGLGNDALLRDEVVIDELVGGFSEA